ncbi:hypothetical protein [Nonomuraea jabiensis]|uniref:hypothetical protein n=1 Tax=Nonomuraea jabiensis TaxID=882448 RepID=UPI0036CF300C
MKISAISPSATTSDRAFRIRYTQPSETTDGPEQRQDTHMPRRAVTTIIRLNAPSMIRLRTSPGSRDRHERSRRRLTFRDHATHRKAQPFRHHHQDGRERAEVRAAAQLGERGNGEHCPDQDRARDEQEVHDLDIS